MRLQAGRILLRVLCRCSASFKHALLLLLHLLIEVLIIVVAIEGLLEHLLIEQLRVLLDLLAVLITPLTVGVSSVEVVSIRRNERSWDALVQQVVPWEVTQPRVVLHVLGTVQSETIQRLTLDETVNEVSSLNGPARRNVSASNLHLPGEYVLTDFTSIASSVGSPAKHALVANNAHSEVVDGDTVRLAAHNLGSHVARRARRIFLVLRVPHSGNTKICDLKIAILVEDEVLWLDVTMQNALLV